MTSEMWKQGRPSTTALVYSAILRFRLLVDSSQLICTAFLGQMAIHRPQPTHLSWSMAAFRSVMTGAPWAQILRHWPQPTHSFCSTWGFPALCCSILPARLPQPMPMFLMAPPKPADSCPLKWVREMNTSASIMARPILAFFTYSPPATGSSTSSLPLRPSAMMT